MAMAYNANGVLWRDTCVKDEDGNQTRTLEVVDALTGFGAELSDPSSDFRDIAGAAYSGLRRAIANHAAYIAEDPHARADASIDMVRMIERAAVLYAVIANEAAPLMGENNTYRERVQGQPPKAPEGYSDNPPRN